MHRLFLLVTLAAIAPGTVQAQMPVTDANWREHPAIKAIRALTADVESQIARRRIAVQTDSAVCDHGETHLVAHLFTDSMGRARKYVIEGGSGDSAGDVTFYYDVTGKLRFMFARVNAVNGTREEDRTYFDSTGTQLYENTRMLHGPGHAGGFTIVLAPVEDFHQLCGPSN